MGKHQKKHQSSLAVKNSMDSMEQSNKYQSLAKNNEEIKQQI